MGMRNGRIALARRAATITASVSAVALLASCGAGDEGAAPATDGPVKIDMWGWDTTTQPQLVKAFNESQDDWEVNYVTQASNTATQTNFQNLMASGGDDVPCYVQGFTTVTSAVAEGWVQDVTDLVEASGDLFSEGAKAGAEVNGKYYGIPTGGSAQFMMVNVPALEAAGVDVPQTWEDVLAAAPKLHDEGIDVLNLPGEDPSGFMNLVQQSGGEWFAIEDDHWVIDFVDDETLRAADFYQQLIDNDWVSNQTYQDKPALYSYFDSGKLALVPLAWWSMTGYVDNFSESLGDWSAVPSPAWSDASDTGVPGLAGSTFVPVGCEYPQAAMAFAEYASSSEGIEASRSEDTGAIAFPAAVPDASDYVEDIVPDTLFSQEESEVGEVVVDAQANMIGKFESGPNYTAWFPELQDQWGKVVAGDQSLEQALQNVQDFVVADLEKKGISYTVG